MSVLSDKDIIGAIGQKIFSINPFIPNNIQPASIDLTLYKYIEIFDQSLPIDLTAISSQELNKRNSEVDISNGYTLLPKHYIVGYSNELLRFSTLINGRLCNRNSFARLGINAAISSYINPGFEGRAVITIYNFGNSEIKLQEGVRICQLELHYLHDQTIRNYCDRHDINKIYDDLEILNKKIQYDSKEPLDNPISDFLNERIHAAAWK